MASDQQVKLNLVISAEDQAQSVIKDFVSSIEDSFKSLQETLKSLNDFKFKNPISKSTVDSIKSNVKEINSAFESIGNVKAKDNATVSPLAKEAKTAQSDASTIVKSMQRVSDEVKAIRDGITSSPIKLLPGAAESLTPALNGIKSLSTEIRTDTPQIEDNVRGWGKAFATLVVDVQQDADGVYKAMNDIKNGVESASTSFGDLRKAINDVELVFGILPGDVSSAMGKASADVASGATRISEDLQRVKTRVNDTKDTLRKGFDFMQLQFAGQQAQQWGQQITGFFMNALTLGAGMNQSIMNVAGSLRAQGESARRVNAQLKQMNNYALQLGSQGYFSANQVADAMNVMAKQGISYQTIMGGALKAAANVAAANQEDLTATANVISDIVHEMGGSLVQQYGTIGSAMQHVGDQMTVALHHSRLSMTDFLNSMKYAGPQASNLGVHFSDLASSIAVLGEHGIRGSQAGTTLRRALQELAAPTSTALKEMQSLGLATANGTTVFTDATGHLKSLADVQRILYERLQVLSPAQREQALQSMFSMYAVSGMTAIANTTPAAFQAMTKAMAQNGTAQSILAEKSQGVGFQIQHMKAQWTTFMKQLGELFLPLASRVLTSLTRMVSAIQSFVSLHPGMAKMMAIFAAAFGTFMLGGGALANVIGTFGMFKTALVDLIPALSAVEIGFGPVLLVVAAAGVAAAGLYFAWKHNLGGIRDITKEAIQGVVSWFKRISPELNQLKREIVSVVNFLSPVWKAFWDSFKTIADTVWKVFIALIKADWQILSGVFTLFLDLLTGHWKKAWDDVQQIFHAFYTMFDGVFNAFVQGIEALIKINIDMWRGLWDNGWKLMGTSLTSAWTTMKAAVATALKDVVGTMRDVFIKLPQEALQWGENMMNMLIQGIEGKIADLATSVGKIASTVKSFLGFHSPTELGPASDSDQWMPNMMKMFQSGIQQQLPSLQASLKLVASTVQQTVAPRGVMGGVTNVSNVVNNAPTYAASPRGANGGVVVNIGTVNAPGYKGNTNDLANQLAKAIRQQMPVVSA